MKTNTRTIKILFEKLKKRAKKNYYADQIAKSIGNTKKTWSVIKKIIGKTKDNIEKFPKQLIIENELTLQKDKIANKFNDFFINVGPKLAAKIPSSTKTHSSYLDTCDTLMSESELNIKEMRSAFASLQPNKSPGRDDISVNIVKRCYDIIEPSLFYIFSLSLKYGQFPDQLKNARVTPIFKSGENSDVTNYRPISVLPCFSKVLE